MIKKNPSVKKSMVHVAIWTVINEVLNCLFLVGKL